MSNTPSSKTSAFDEIQHIVPKAVDTIISTLAKENGWLSDDNNNSLYNYQGFWYYGFILPGIIDTQCQEVGLNPSPFDIIVASNPKSGTTWLKALCFVISTRTQFPIARFEDHPLHSTNPHTLVPMIEGYKAWANIDHGLPLLATHLHYTSIPSSILASGCKIVYIWRDPKDAFISLWRFCHKIRANKDVTEPIPLEEAFDLFCRGISSYGPFWDHVLGYWRAFLDRPNNILFLKYENMMSDAEFHVKRLAEFMGFPFSSEEEKEGVITKVVEMCSFESMSNLAGKKWGYDINPSASVSLTHDAFFRKGKIGDWKNYLTEEMASKIDRITIDKLGSCGLTL